MRDCTLTWHKLSRRIMPPEGERFLLWMGLKDDDGGFPVVAYKKTDRDGSPYIMFHGADDGWKVLFVCEWRHCAWAVIPKPEELMG